MRTVDNVLIFLPEANRLSAHAGKGNNSRFKYSFVEMRENIDNGVGLCYNMFNMKRYGRDVL